MRKSPVPDRIDSLQCLRGLAALGVFLSHISQVEKLHFATKLPSGMGVGAYGVDLFFVLSGFVIIHSLSRRPSGPRETAAFMVARWGRIFPAYWAVFIPCAIISALVGVAWVTDTPPAPMLQSGLLLPASAPPLVHPAWSLVHELYFYSVLGLLMLAPRRWLIPALVVWGLGMVGIQLAFGGRIENPILHLAANPLNLDFLLGAAVRLALPWIRTPWPRLQTLACGLAFLAGAAVLTVMKDESKMGEWHRVMFVGLPATGVIWGACFWQPAAMPRIWSSLRALGDRSYVFYLVHFPICMVVSSWMHATGRQGWGNIALYVALAAGGTALATELLHRGVERPSLKLAHRLARRISQPGARPAAPSVPPTSAAPVTS